MRLGKKTIRNLKISALLKRVAITMGMPELCEAAYKKWKGCTPRQFLSWAHSKRRNNWTDESDKYRVGLLCISCHATAQNLGNEENEKFILEVEKRRGWSFADLVEV